MADLKSHPFSEVFSIHDGQTLWDMANDMYENGQREDVVLLDGMILDGRRRYMAHLRNKRKHGDVPDLRMREFGSRKSDGKCPLRFVASVNLYRRHLGEAERQMSAAKIANLSNGQKKSIISQEKVHASPFGEAEISQAEAAKIMNVSKRGVERAAKVLKNGSTALKQAVADGAVSMSDAAEVVDNNKHIQDKALRVVVNGKAKTLKKAVERIEQDLVDGLGNAVPKNLRDVFTGYVQALDNCGSLLSQVKKTAMNLSSWNPYMRQAEIEATLNALIEDFENGTPYAVCSECNGKGCDDCRKEGWITEWRHKEVTL